MRRILVTDDNTDYRKNIMEMLEMEGFEVLEAANGQDALTLINTQTPDLILCDIDMPGLDGFEVLRQAKQNPQTASIPFILVSGHMDAESIRLGDRLAVDDYMIKPMNFEVLLLKINQLLNER